MCKGQKVGLNHGFRLVISRPIGKCQARNARTNGANIKLSSAEVPRIFRSWNTSTLWCCLPKPIILFIRQCYCIILRHIIL